MADLGSDAAGRRRLDLTTPGRRNGAAVALGVIAGLGQAPFDLPWLTVIGLVLVFRVFIATPGVRAAAWTGWSFGVGYFAVALHWIVEPFLVNPEAHLVLAPFGLVGMVGGLSLFWAVGFAVARTVGGVQPARGALALALSLTLVEAGRAYLFTGFPWAMVAQVWTDTSMRLFLAHVGPHGLTFLTLLIAASAAIGSLASKTIWRFAGLVPAAGFVLAGILLEHVMVAPPDTDHTARLIQPNAAQHEKWDREMIPVFFDRQVSYTAANPTPDLVIWPETAVPGLLEHSAEIRQIVSSAATNVPVVLGIQRQESGRYYNSLALLGPEGRVDGFYDKHHLVPFGEYMPWPALWARIGVFGLAARAKSGYSAGPGPALLDLGPAGRALPLICYEAVFPQIASNAPERPDILLQITNDAWFGEFSGPYQHLAQARMRATEQGLPLARSANTGVSAMIDALGNIRASLPLGQAGYVDAVLPAPAPRTLYARFGDVPALAVLLVGLAVLIMTRPKKAD